MGVTELVMSRLIETAQNATVERSGIMSPTDFHGMATNIRTSMLTGADRAQAITTDIVSSITTISCTTMRLTTTGRQCRIYLPQTEGI